MIQFDPNSAASEDSGIFGLPFTRQEAKLVYLPVPWEATTSYGGGTAQGPSAIFTASKQVDLFDLEIERPYEAGFYMLPEDKKIRALNKKAKAAAQIIIQAGGQIKNSKAKNALQTVNQLSAELNKYVLNESRKILEQGKIIGLVGGDHSTPFGAIQAIAEREKSFGILHIDAHSDTRDAYEGFQWSHASIMRNVMEKIPEVKKLVQVGIRDFCEEEWDFIQASPERIKTYFDLDCAKRKSSGLAWDKIADEIITQLPANVWVSFDIDGLDPRFCPHTGTPVPGGLDYLEAIVLLGKLARSGKKILGFDLNEVAPGKDEWDANVGARMLYKLSAYTILSQGLAKTLPSR